MLILIYRSRLLINSGLPYTLCRQENADLC